MINPSANGWIDKYFQEQNRLLDCIALDSLSQYENIRKTGFVYGHIISINSNPKVQIENWTTEEISKVALLNTLFDSYRHELKQCDFEDFVHKALAFYNEITPNGFGFFNKIIPSSESSKLESLIEQRVQTNKDIISKNFSYIVTNALLFIDVLAFRHYLKEGKLPDKYLKRMEETIINLVSLALQIKTSKTHHDDLFIKLFEASVRYTKFSKNNIQNLDSLPLDYFYDDLEKYYFIDITGLTLWSDEKLENNEAYFLHKLAETLKITDGFVTSSIMAIDSFIKNHKSEIQYFNYSNPVKHFYEQTTSNVQLLIKRNQKRLTKEIVESKELLHLLKQSTKRDLTQVEKKKVKKQLLDICKSVPSLTIFLLPGGSLLLPILVKFIPQLLPSAFNENLED